MRQVIERITCTLCGNIGYSDAAEVGDEIFIAGSLTVGINTWEFDLCPNCTLESTMSTIAQRGVPVTKKPTPPTKPKKHGKRVDREFTHDGAAPKATVNAGKFMCGCGKSFVTERGYKKHWTQAGGEASGNSTLKVAI